MDNFLQILGNAGGIVELGDLGFRVVKKIIKSVTKAYGEDDYSEAGKAILNDLVIKVYGGDIANLDKALKLSREIKLGVKASDLTSKIMPYLEDDVVPEEADDETISRAFEKYSHAIKEERVETWAQIIALELNKPHSVSRRLIHIFDVMSDHEAETFYLLCRYCFEDMSLGIGQPIIFIRDAPRFYLSDINSYSLNDLQYLGLIQTDYTTGFSYGSADVFGVKTFMYEGTIITVEGHIPAGNVRFTKDGQTLYSILKSNVNFPTNNQTIENTIEMWKDSNLHITLKRVKNGKEKIVVYVPDNELGKSKLL